MPFNARELDEEIFNNASVKLVAIQTIKAEFEKAKKELIEEFQNHPVTKDIRAGAFGVDQDDSGIMGGYGNLFAFIGFEAGTDPTEQVVELLQDINLNEASIKQQGGHFYGETSGPGYDEILAETHLPELEGLSWVAGIEDGISNLSHFLSRLNDSDKSKSKQGYQVKTDLGRGLASTRPTPYLSDMLKRFHDKLN